MPYKTVVANGYHLAYKAMGLYPAVIANGHIFLYLCKGPHKAIVANVAAIYIAGVHNGNVVAHGYV
jgi:hypothetical protein